MTMSKPTSKDVARFIDKVQITKHCWLWIGRSTSRERGRFFFNGKIMLATHFSYQLFVRPIEAGEQILHTRECGNPRCVNPHHLYVGTRADNMRDMRVWGNVAVGERHGSSKLSNYDVLTIRRIHKNNRRSYKATADAFGVDPTLISHMVRRDNWKHLP